MKEVLTGFKFIGEKIKESEETGVEAHIFLDLKRVMGI